MENQSSVHKFTYRDVLLLSQFMYTESVNFCLDCYEKIIINGCNNNKSLSMDSTFCSRHLSLYTALSLIIIFPAFPNKNVVQPNGILQLQEFNV